MKCPKCQHENPNEAVFCGSCGAKLSLVCPQCASENPPMNKFCMKCGLNFTIPSEPALKDLSFDEKLEKIQKYLPKGITEKILAHRDRIEGERKQVTVMFCDMEGFTQLSERLGPEEAYTIMDEVYEILIHKVHDYEGTVNEMTGDGIMALFGAPIALEDAPLRAIRSAYSIHREIARFNDRTKQEKENFPPLKMRIGIHTGPVVVGTLGNDLRVEFKAVGNTVNLASRMEGLAEPGTTYVSDDTFKLTEGFFRFEALGEREVKGKEGPVNVFRVIAPSSRRTRFDVSAERGLTHFVGRERELDLLLDGFERSKAGRGQAFSVAAEAGIGKSRLLYEFRKFIANEDVTFLEGKCLSYGRGQAYHPLIDILKSSFDITDGDGDLDIRDKVQRSLKPLGLDDVSVLPYFLELLSVKDSGFNQIALSPEGKKDRIIEAFKRIVLKGSEVRSLILAFEDLHWSDKSSEEVMKGILESITGSRVLLIFTYRPEFVHTWGARSYHSQVTLNRLSNREGLNMTAHVLGTEDIDPALADLILDKTEGIPFFIEEFIKSLKDLRIIERKNNTYHLGKDIREVTIPSTIQDVIMARVDILPEAAKELLQTGSVIEREFRFKLIKKVLDLSEQELLSRLSVLKDSELLFERGIYPETTYIFKHALTQEVVYDSILIRRKKKLHEMIGNAIEDLYKENISEYYGVLAEHFISSENYDKGEEYCRLSSKKTEKAASFIDAISYGKKRINCLERLHPTVQTEKKIIDARTSLGLYYNQTNHDIEAKEIVSPIVNLAIKRGYKKRISQIYSILGAYNFFCEGNLSKTFTYLSDALKIAEDLNDILSLFMANYWLGIALWANCEFDKSLFRHEKALEINKATNTLWGEAISKSQISFMVYDCQGKNDLGYQTSCEAKQIAEESGDILSKAVVYTCHGYSCNCKGSLDEAMEHLSSAIDFCERIDLIVWAVNAHWFLGDTYFYLERYKKSREHYDKALSLIERGRIKQSYFDSLRLALARAEVKTDARNIDLESLNIKGGENKFLWYNCCQKRYIAEILLNIDDRHLSKAEKWIMKSIKADKKFGMMWNLARDYALYAELFKRKGDPPKAKEKLNKAIEIFKECGADGWVEKYEKELTEL